jgi:tetratricopeptide (TPR) repeat protein
MRWFKRKKEVKKNANALANAKGSGSSDRLLIPMCALVCYQNLAHIDLILLNLAVVGLNKLSVKVIASFNSVGIAHHAKGQYDEAILNYCKALKVLEEQGCDNACIHGVICSNIGTSMCARGQFDNAIAEYKKAIALFKSRGERQNAAAIANCENNVGVVLQKTERYKEAMREHQKALAIRTAVLGKRHPDTLRSISTILGDPQAANQCE